MSRPCVVVVHRNQASSCLRTVAEFRRQSVAVDIIVVDNGSERPELETLRALSTEGPRAEATSFNLIELASNTGFGAAANVGLRRWLADGDGAEWAFVAPHDALPAPGTLAAMLAVGRSTPQAGLLSADVGDQVRPTIDRFFGPLPQRALGYEGFEPVDYPHGTLLAIRRDCANDVGLFDERYFAYSEEADLGLRCKAAGWQVGLVRNAMVANPVTSGAGVLVDYLKHRNTLLLLREHSGRWPALVRSMVLILEVVDGTVRPGRRPPWFHRWARLRGLVDHVRGRYGPPPPDL